MAHKKPISEAQLQGMSTEELEEAVRYHNRRYWEDNVPEISDYDYDRLVRRLRDRAPESEVLQDLGAHRFGREVKHREPMLSLDKCYSDEGLLSWAEKFEGSALASPKLDGIACSLRYDEAGHLAVAATRGNGRVGDDITVNARTISDIPERIAAEEMEVRGEIYMRLSVFGRYREEFANPRNLAAGAVKHKDPARCRAYELSFAAFGLVGGEETTEAQKLDRLKVLGFDTLAHRVGSKSELVGAYQHFAAKRAEADFETDGVVFKANSVSEQRRLGATGHHPRWAIAYKFQGDSATTKLHAVAWSVARSGVITPVARVAPVVLSGATVSRASLHNAGFVRKLQLTRAAQVVVSRRGGVIPKIEFVVAPEGEAVSWPEACPSCGGAVESEGDFLFCARPESCRSAVIGTLMHYCKVLDIQGFGERIAGEAYDRGILGSPADLYTVSKRQLVQIDRVGDKLAEKLLSQINDHRRVWLSDFLRALGIPEVGRHVADILAEEYGTVEAVRDTTHERLAALHGIGEVTAGQIVAGMRRQAELIDRLLGHVTVIGAEEEDEERRGPLAGMRFVFTGKMEAFERKEAQARVRALGGETPSSVTQDLHYLVVGAEKDGRKSNKERRAEALQEEGAPLKVITEEAFLSLLEQAEAPR